MKENNKPKKSINRGGAPRKENPKNTVITLRINRLQEIELEKMQKKGFYNSKSEMLNDIIFNKKYKVVQINNDFKKYEELGNIKTALNKIGTNINQLTKIFNSPKYTNLKSQDVQKNYNELINLKAMLLETNSKLEEL